MTTSQWINYVLSNLLDLSTLISIIIIIVLTIIAIKIGDKALLKLEKKYDLNLTAHYLFKDLLKYGIIIIALALILHLLGIDLQNIILSLGIVSIIIGFASKDIVSNFVSGMFVIGDKNVQVGDTIEVDGRKGAVTKVGFRNTTMIGIDNFKVTIPNSVLSTKTYKNFPPMEDYRIRLSAILPHGMNIHEFKENINESMKKYPYIDKEKDCVMLATEMMEDGAKLEVSFWVKEYEDRDPGKVDLLEEINKLISDYLNNS